jgi:hypothetical protein
LSKSIGGATYFRNAISGVGCASAVFTLGEKKARPRLVKSRSAQTALIQPPKFLFVG